MSTVYRALKPPYTSIRVEKLQGSSIDVVVFISHQNAGKLVVRDLELADVVKVFFSDDICAVTSAALNNQIKLDVLYNVLGDTCLMSDGGHITSLSELRESVETLNNLKKEEAKRPQSVTKYRLGM